MRPGQGLSLSYTGQEDEDVRADCEAGWLRLSEAKCCRLETRALSWQVDISSHPPGFYWIKQNV